MESAAGPRPARAHEPGVLDLVLANYVGERNALGEYEGMGKATFKGGHTYEGQYVAGRMHGEGTYTWSDGIKYSGSFVNDAIEGAGVYTWPDGACYEGAVSAGRRHGQGSLRFADSPVCYEGAWARGRRHGTGTLYFDAGRSAFYAGEWADDAKHGLGRLVYASGNWYDGDWVRDRKEGHGRMAWVASHETYVGTWEGGLPHGHGEHTWHALADAASPAPGAPEAAGSPRSLMGGAPAPEMGRFLMRNRYVGAMAAGKRHGSGTFFYSTGARYEGDWVANAKHGLGTLTFDNGGEYSGPFVADRPAGGAQLMLASQASHVVLAIDDLLIEEADAAASKAAVGHLLLRYNSELRHLYAAYSRRPGLGESAPLPPAEAAEGAGVAPSPSPTPSSRPSSSSASAAFPPPPTAGESDPAAPPSAPSAPSPSPASTLTLAQFRRLAADCRLPSPELPLSALDAHFAAAARSAAALAAAEATMAAAAGVKVGGGKVGVGWTLHDARRPALAREFFESLVRVAHARYHALPSLERRVHRLLTALVLPRGLGSLGSFRARDGAGVATPPPPPPPADGFTAAMAEGEAAAAAMAAAPGLRSIFSALAKGGETVTLRDVALCLHCCGLLSAEGDSSPGWLPLAGLALAARAACFGDDDGVFAAAIAPRAPAFPPGSLEDGEDAEGGPASPDPVPESVIQSQSQSQSQSVTLPESVIEPGAPPPPPGRAYPPADPWALDAPLLPPEFESVISRCAALAAGDDDAGLPGRLTRFYGRLFAAASVPAAAGGAGVLGPGNPGYVAPVDVAEATEEAGAAPAADAA